jgi:stage II sporulation protein D
VTTAAVAVRVSAPGEFYLVEKAPETPRRTVAGTIEIRVEQGGLRQQVYQVQVASLSRIEAAEELSRNLAAKFRVPASVRHNPTTGTNQVRVGSFESREEALAFANDTLRPQGYTDFLVVRETQEREGGETTLALRGEGQLFRVNRAGYLFVPSAEGGFLHLEGKPFRGILDVTLNTNGRLTVVNQLPLEEYLFGVVPAEISPSQYPEYHALAAQAIAARTFALRNMGRFRSEGFDLTADTRTQVYGGVSAEKDATSQAVQKTAGLALYFEGNPIDAMYASTCGGRTEDFSNVFDAPPVPYLRSVACSAEESSSNGTRLEGVADDNGLAEPLFADDGSIANRALELAAVLGIPGRSLPALEELAAPATEDDIRAWTERSSHLAGPVKGALRDGSSPVAIATRAGFLRYAAEQIFGSPAIQTRISDSDAEYQIGNLADGSSVPQPARRAIAFLIQGRLWHAYPDNTLRPSEPIRRSDALFWLSRWVESVRPELMRTGAFAGPGLKAAEISVKAGNRTYGLSLAPQLRLFKVAAGRSTQVASLQVIGNERLRYHLDTAGAVDFLEVELNATGTVSDRFSPVAEWEVVVPRSRVAESLRSMAGNIGEIRDLRPAKQGASGRVVRMEVIGSRGSIVLNGYRVRSALGLRDTLFTISREVNAGGTVEKFTFRGRGWGHGVGLCQVGAYGMARAGRTFEEILKTYYLGVELRKAY